MSSPIIEVRKSDMIRCAIEWQPSEAATVTVRSTCGRPRQRGQARASDHILSPQCLIG